MLITLIPVWQLVIIPGIIAGFLNKTMKYSILSGAIGVATAWLIYILFGIITRNVLIILDQFGALILGDGFGWLLLLLIMLFSVIFGALGGGIGNGLLNLKDFYFEKNSRKE
jgi:hypothetical protein